VSMAALDPVFIIDDDPAARDSMAALVQSHGLPAEIFASGEEFLAQFDRSKSGCLVVDVRMSGITGLELQARLNEEGIELPVVVISGYGDIPTAVHAMRNGAITFLEKACGYQKLWNSISQALEIGAENRVRRSQQCEIRRRLATLTPDERRVLEKLLDGRPNKAIARDLDLGLRTVELRRAVLLQKMQASSLAELVRMVVQADGQPLNITGQPLPDATTAGPNSPH
jgi:two-component system, LuxR family, response regulator FixJ